MTIPEVAVAGLLAAAILWFVARLERGLSASKPGYADYVARTSPFLPWLPKRQRR